MKVMRRWKRYLNFVLFELLAVEGSQLGNLGVQKVSLCLCVTLLMKRQLLIYFEIGQYTSIRNLLHVQSNQLLFSWVFV